MRNVVARITGVACRAFGALLDLRHNQIDWELTCFLIRSGGRLTDGLEFEMIQHLLSDTQSSAIGND